MTNAAGLGSGAIFLMWSLAALLSAVTVPRVSSYAPVPSAEFKCLAFGRLQDATRQSLQVAATHLVQGAVSSLLSKLCRYRGAGSCAPA